MPPSRPPVEGMAVGISCLLAFFDVWTCPLFFLCVFYSRASFSPLRFIFPPTCAPQPSNTHTSSRAMEGEATPLSRSASPGQTGGVASLLSLAAAQHSSLLPPSKPTHLSDNTHTTTQHIHRVVRSTVFFKRPKTDQFPENEEIT